MQPYLDKYQVADWELIPGLVEESDGTPLDAARDELNEIMLRHGYGDHEMIVLELIHTIRWWEEKAREELRRVKSAGDWRSFAEWNAARRLIRNQLRRSEAIIFA